MIHQYNIIADGRPRPILLDGKADAGRIWVGYATGSTKKSAREEAEKRLKEAISKYPELKNYQIEYGCCR